VSFRIAGAYFESCNCEAICPCRMVGGVRGGRSTYGVCFGVLSWRIDEGGTTEADLAGLAVAMTIRYDDDEPGSPWSLVLHVDERGTELQRRALEQIFLGELGGDLRSLPWNRKPRAVVDVRVSRIEVESGPAAHELHVHDRVELRASRPVETGEPVRCGIPGYDQPGSELYADLLAVDDDPFEWRLVGNCAFASAFAYSG
jgi:Protein of unknown function (DUF1326)